MTRRFVSSVFGPGLGRAFHTEDAEIAEERPYVAVRAFGVLRVNDLPAIGGVMR